jgi:Zn-dependent M16 (insulinase) family peptidase
VDERSRIPEPELAVGDEVEGFRVDRVTALEEIRARLYEAHDTRTGARLAHIHCFDPENLFSVGFATPPADSRGTPHILEHAVLAGSARFPVKDAFSELERRSLATFLNAFTWPDRTLYPVCSAVRADYENLATVYGDLVFHPRLLEQTFLQEGVHVAPRDLDGPGDALTYAGVVYNEMRGAYSSPEQQVERALRQRLLPDTIYRHDSGGDPDVIPELTHAALVDFHRRHYAAANARFLLYGDVPPRDNLGLCAGLLARTEPGEAIAEPALQPRWSEPRAVELRYPIGPDAETAGRSFCILSWLSRPGDDVEGVLAMEVIIEALVGSAAGPLRRALIDSGLGADLYPVHAYDTEGRESIVRFGLRGTDPERADEIERLVLQTLGRIAAEGLDRELVAASLHQVELAGREITPPFPVLLLTRASRLWYHGGEPADGLRFGQQVEALRARLEREPDLLERMIREELIHNPHRLRLVASPDRTLLAEKERALSERLAALRAGMHAERVEELRARAVELRAAQEAPDTPEAIATLPKLAPADVPRAVRRVPTHIRQTGGVTVLEHPTFTNGMVYLGLAFRVDDADDDAARWLPLMGAATTGMGAAGLDYEQMARRILRHTGGVGTELYAARHLGTGAPSEWVMVDGKALGRNAGELFAILGDLVTAPDAGDTKRLRDLVREAATRAEGALVPRGSRLALLRAAEGLGRHHRRRERWSGVSQLLLLRELARGIDDGVGALGERLAGLQRRFFTRGRAVVSVCADPETLEALRPQVDALVGRLAEGEMQDSGAAEPSGPSAPDGPPTGIACATEVSFVAKAMPAVRIDDPASPAMELLTHVLSLDYFYKRLRVQGGAYGGWCSYALEDGVVAMVSYRDPQLAKTLETYAGALAWAREHLTDAALEACRLGVIGARDRILSPEEMMSVARRRWAIGLTDDARQAFKDGILGMPADEVRRLAFPVLEEGLGRARAAVLSSRDRLEQAGEALSAPFAIIDAG